MTPAQDRVVRRRAEEVQAWAKEKLDILTTYIEYPVPFKSREHGDNWQQAMTDHYAKADAWSNQPEIRAARKEYETLRNLESFCNWRRRHPVVRRIIQSRHLGPREIPGQEPSYWLYWWWSDESKKLSNWRTESPCIHWGDGLALGLPVLATSGRAWFRVAHNKYAFHVEWGIGPGVRSRSLGIVLASDGSEGDITLSVHVPILGYFYLVLSNITPEWMTYPEKKSFTTTSPEGKKVVHEYLDQKDVIVFQLNISPESVSGALWNVHDHMSLGGGSRHFYKLLDTVLWGKITHQNEKIGEPIRVKANLPEGEYELVLQKERSTWKWSRWPWAYWREFVDIEATAPPQFHGKGENSYDIGPDAIWGMSSPGHNLADAVAAYVKETLKYRMRRGVLKPEHNFIISDPNKPDTEA